MSTVYVVESSQGRWHWHCGCGARRGNYRDERACRDDGFAHQKSHDPQEERTR